MVNCYTCIYFYKEDSRKMQKNSRLRRFCVKKKRRIIFSADLGCSKYERYQQISWWDWR